MENYNAKAVGSRIAQLRKDHGMTQAQLSEKIHVAEKHLSVVERGLHIPSAETLYLIGQVFSVSVDYLLTGSLEKPLNDCVIQLTSGASGGQQEAVWRFLRALLREER